MSFGAGILLPQRYTNNSTGPGTLHLDFQTGAPLDSRITFTRSTTATFVGSDGFIQTAAINSPRFGYDPATLTAKGLLIEEARTNLTPYSADYSFWGNVFAGVTANQGTSPDGLNNASKIVPNNGQASSWISQVGIPASTGTHTLTVYAKPAGLTAFQIGFFNTTDNDRFAVYTLSGSGSVASSSAGTTASIQNAGNGWYRCILTFTTTGTGSTQVQVARLSSGTGDGVNGWLVWGAQLEAGAFATSYIPTVGSTVTRTADIATMTGTNFSSWYNASEGTFVSSFEASPNTFTTYVAASNGVVAQNSMHMDNDGSGNMRVAYYSGSSAVALLSLGAVGTLNVANKVATAYKVNDFAASRNGGAVVTDTAGAVPVGVVQLNIGADPSGAAVNVSNTHIRSITYYPSRLTNVELQALSS